MATKASSESAPPARTKGDKRDRTRAKLLEAARLLIREKGYEQTTLEAIAERAGMTTGAIYGNFKNREDLFMSLGQAYWAPVRPIVKPGATFAEIAQAMAEATIAAIPDRVPAAAGRLSGLAYTLRNEKLRVKVAQFTQESYALGEQWLREMTNPHDLPLPPAQLVRVLHALTEGLVFQRVLTPELVTDDVIRAAFRALVKVSK